MRVFSCLSYIAIFLMLLPPVALAGFAPETLSLSTVRIVTKSKGKVTSVATGFIWAKTKYVVTSLHVLNLEAKSKIIVEFGKKRRLAKVKAILPKADLALLEVKRPIDGWQPLTSFNPTKPKYRSQVTALGYNKGAFGISTRELIKGFAQPEVLKQLLPEKAVDILSKTQIPSVDMPIYYLDGSLLPGYSGSPIVDANGDLIGIGNGGLESGASSVSWVIPASNLTELERSDITAIPESILIQQQLFSLDTIRASQHSATKQPTEKASNNIYRTARNSLKAYWNGVMHSLIPTAIAQEPTNDLETDLSNYVFKEVNYQQFQFIKVKTRSYAEMVASSGNPESIEYALTLFNAFFPNYNIAYDHQLFDVYTDAFYGLNIVVPSESALVVEDGYLLTKGDLFCRSCPYEIQYHARTLTEATQGKIAKNAKGFLHDIADIHWDELSEEGDYREYTDFREIEAFGSHRYVLRAVFSDFFEPFKHKFELNYFSVAYNRDAWLQVQGIVNRFDSAFLKRIDEYRGTDCTSSTITDEQTAVCEDALIAFKVLASTHFTSFSNRLFGMR